MTVPSISFDTIASETPSKNIMASSCGTMVDHSQATRGDKPSIPVNSNSSSVLGQCTDSRAIPCARDQEGAAAAAAAAAAVAAATGGCGQMPLYGGKFPGEQRISPPLSPLSGGVIVTTRNGHAHGPERTVGSCISPLRVDSRRGQVNTRYCRMYEADDSPVTRLVSFCIYPTVLVYTVSNPARCICWRVKRVYACMHPRGIQGCPLRLHVFLR